MLKRGMMKMCKMNLRDGFSWGRCSANRATAANPRTSDVVHANRTLLRSAGIGLFAMLISAIATSLCIAEGSDPNQTPAPASPGIKNSMEPEAYMRELAERLGSADGKEMLLRGLNNEQPRPAAVKPAPKKKPAPTQPIPARSTPPQPVVTQPQPPQPVWTQPQSTTAILTQPIWSHPIETEPVSQKLTLIEPNAPAASEEARTIIVRDPNVLAAELASQPPKRTEPNAPAVPAAARTIMVRDPNVPAAPPASQPPRVIEPSAPAVSAGPALQQPKPSEPSAPAAPAERPPLDPATWLSIYNKAAEKGLKDIQAERLAKGNKPWSLGSDLEKYRAHSVKDGSRDSGESLTKALARAGLAVNDGVNVFMLGYASDRAEALRGNDGKGLLDEPGRVPQQAGATLADFGDGLYSLADLITLNALPDPNKPAYRDNVPIVRPIIFAGRTVGGIWKTTEEIGNAVTWGYFDNVTGCLGMLLEDVIEVLKHAGEAVTNVARLPMHAIGAKGENAEKTMDWVLLVPLEMVSNSVEMKGIANTGDYKTAFAEKGVIGSIVEFGGSSFVLYRAIDETLDKMKDDHKHHHSSNNNNNNNNNNNGSGNSGGNSGGSTSGTPGAGSDETVIWVGDIWPWWPPS